MVFQYASWPLPSSVYAGWTERQNGASSVPFDHFNVAHHVGDCAQSVELNRARLEASLIGQPRITWLNQIHSTAVVLAQPQALPVTADACYTKSTAVACCVMTADCLPVFFWTHSGDQVAVAHAGWRGLANGILENTARQFGDLSRVSCGLGPAIGGSAFEVGVDVKDAFKHWSHHERAFQPTGVAGKYWADLALLASLQLQALGVAQVYQSHQCTYTRAQQFFSYRREGRTGRMANIIWKVDA